MLRLYTNVVPLLWGSPYRRQLFLPDPVMRGKKTNTPPAHPVAFLHPSRIIQDIDCVHAWREAYRAQATCPHE